jgi:TPP-dependent pyruvate/acetoin dehydrogenase alpha subunit
LQTHTPITLPQDCSRDKPLEGETSFLTGIYRQMFLIRSFELRVNEMFLKGLVPGTIHLSHGQEAAAVGACAALRPDDVITLTHRGHGQALAKGIPTGPLLAELLGKETGCCGGKGGSLHVGDLSVGALPAIAIVGAAAPIATGLAFAFKRQGSDRVACTFFGEGAANKGDWHEAMNLAAVWRLPVVFLCENNLYASTTRISEVMRGERVAERAAGYGMEGVSVDGNDPLDVFGAVDESVVRARAGGGPTLVECLTYRRGGHKREDPGAYRPKEEVDAWLGYDPIPTFRQRLVRRGVAEQELQELEVGVMQEIDAAAEFALSSEYPKPERASDHVYS